MKEHNTDEAYPYVITSSSAEIASRRFSWSGCDLSVRFMMSTTHSIQYLSSSSSSIGACRFGDVAVPVSVRQAVLF